MLLLVVLLDRELAQDTIIIIVQTVKLETLGPDALWGGKDSKELKYWRVISAVKLAAISAI